MTIYFKLAGAAVLLALAACGEEKGPGGVTAGEESRLDNAASMLDNSGTIAVPDDSLSAGEPEEETPAEGNAAENTQ